jgi:hypothetical protein
MLFPDTGMANEFRSARRNTNACPQNGKERMKLPRAIHCNDRPVPDHLSSKRTDPVKREAWWVVWIEILAMLAAGAAGNAVVIR